MLRVATIQAERGMRLALPVHRPMSDDVLLREGFVLDGPTIGRLREIRIPEVWIDYPGAERIRSLISPQVLRLQARLASQVSDLFDRVQRQAGAKLNYNTYRDSVGSMLDGLLVDRNAALHLSEIAGAGGSLPRHATAVCLLSLLLGLRLEGYLVHERAQLHVQHARNTTSLGVGAMLHDVGLTRLPEHAATHEHDLDADDEAWRSHTRLGFDLVSSGVDASAAIVVLDHHQRWDGVGFPEHDHFGGAARPQRGREIHVFARIAAVADAYDRLLHRPGEESWPRVRVLRTLLSPPLCTRFDPVVLTTLPVVAPPYPPGSMVTLNDGRRAFILNWDMEAPCRPIVVPAEPGSTKRSVKETPIDLREHESLSIVEQDGHDVRADNFEHSYKRALLEARSQAAVAADDDESPGAEKAA